MRNVTNRLGLGVLVQRPSGLVVPEEYASVPQHRSPLTRHELERLQELRQALQEVRSSDPSESQKTPLMLAEEAGKFADELLARYSVHVAALKKALDDRAIGLDVDLPSEAQGLLAHLDELISLIECPAWADAHSKYEAQGKMLSPEEWSRQGRPNLASGQGLEVSSVATIHGKP
jgi:hypothetical protein